MVECLHVILILLVLRSFALHIFSSASKVRQCLSQTDLQKDDELFKDQTHPKALNFDHVSWTTFAEDLTKAGQSIFSPHPARYEGVHALLMNWVDDDLGTDTELAEMNALFQKDFQYSSEMWKIPTEWSEDALEGKLSDVKRNFGKEKRLLIVYYGGHGRFDSSGRSIWQA